MPSKGSSFDVKIDTCTQENQQCDISKLLGSCPVVRLRGLSTSKNRRKKTRTLNRFEVFVFLNMMSFAQLLRSLVAHIAALLLRAGDVELNPGPPPTAISPIRDRTEPSSVSTSNQDTDQLTPASDEPIHGQVKPLEASSPDLNLPVNREGTALNTPLNTAVPSFDLQFFPGKEEALDNVVSNISSDVKRPISQAEQQKNKSMVIGIAVRQEKAEENDSEVGASNTDQPTTKSDFVALSSQTQKRLSLQRTASPKDIASGVHKQSRKSVLQQQGNVLQLLETVLDKEPVDDATAARRLLHFFVGANKLYRSGEKCPVCPICLKLKKESGGQQKSHVIPKGILHYYWKMHSTSEKTDYILDFSRDERLAAGSLTYQLLCGDCETYYSTTEQHLLNVYVYLAANPNIDIIITHKDMYATSWLKHILANILFRGVLTNIDLDERFWQESIIDEVYSLWKFCTRASSTLPNLKVFLLPNKPFCSNLGDFMYPFEILIRMPRCTELIQQKDEGMFLYTKFDCFHVVLPLCETSRAYFETFNNGLVAKDCDLCLRWSIHPKTEKITRNKLIDFKYPPECASLKDHFPEILLRWCASLYEEFISRVYNHPRLRHSFLAGIERYRGAQYVGFNVKERMQQAEALKRNIFDERASQTTTFEEQCNLLGKEKFEKYVLKASRQSPLRRKDHEELQQLRKEYDTEVAYMNAALADTKRDLGDTRKELGSTRDRLEKAEQNLETCEEVSGRQITTLQTEVTRLSDKVSYQDEKMAITVSDLLSSRAELKDSREENTTLREELDSARADQEQLEDIIKHQSQIHQKDFERIRFLYTSSLRHSLTRSQEQNMWTIDLLKKAIDDMASDFEYLTEVTQGRNLQQVYKELHDKCKKLLTLSPPTTPTSTENKQLCKRFE